MNKRPWTTTEIAILKECWPQGGTKACRPRLPDREIRSIICKADKLRLHIAGHQDYKYIQWTDFLDKQVQQAYTSPIIGTIKATAKRLGINYGAFRMRARKLGCVRHYHDNSWSKEENAMVQEYTGHGLRYIQRKLKSAGFQRSLAAISSRIYRLGCAGDFDPDTMNASELARLCGLDTHTVLRWIKSKKLKAKRGEALFSISPKPDYLWRIKIADFIRFARDHPSEIDLRRVDGPWFIATLAGPPAIKDTTGHSRAAEKYD